MFNPEYREPYPPEWRPLGKMKFFYDQPFKIQYFIFLKYTLKRPKKRIKKYMFLVWDDTYYKYDHLAKNIVSEAYKSELPTSSN